MFDILDMIIWCGVFFVIGAVIATAAIYVMLFMHGVEYTEKNDCYLDDDEMLYDAEDYR